MHSYNVWSILGELNGKNDVEIAFNIQLSESIVGAALHFPAFWLMRKGQSLMRFTLATTNLWWLLTFIYRTRDAGMITVFFFGKFFHHFRSWHANDRPSTRIYHKPSLVHFFFLYGYSVSLLFRLLLVYIAVCQ